MTSTIVGPWEGFQFHRLREVPKLATDDDESRRTALGVLAAALTGSHADLLATGGLGALAVAWARTQHDEQLHVLVGGRPFFPPAVGGSAEPSPARRARPVLFPPGATASDVPVADAVGIFESFPCWVPCAGRSDALWVPSSNGRAPLARRRGSFDRYAAHWGAPFAWLVIAEPLPPGDVEPELDLLVSEIVPLSRHEVGEARRVELERKQARHRELSRVQLDGAWRVRVLVGGMDSRNAETAAAMLCAASELDGLPYVLGPAAPATSLAAASALPEDEFGGRTAFTGGTELLAALTRPPERELPGLHVVQVGDFDVTPESHSSDGVHLGEVIDAAGTPVGHFRLGAPTLNRHTFVCGATGSGKSMTIRHLLAETSRAGIPWLVVEPAKAEYARMAGRLAELGQDLVVIRPGAADSPPAGFNPLEPAPGFPLQTHADLVGALFLAAFEAHEPFPQIVRAALVRAYEDLGWDLSLGEAAHPRQRPRYPTLGDLQRVAAEVITTIGYGDEVSADVHGFIRVRLDSLRLGTTGRFFEGGHPLDFERLLGRNVVLEIEDVGDDADKAFFIGAVLVRLAEQLRMSARDATRRGLTHVTVIEEAHRLLRRPDPGTPGTGAHAVEMFASMLAEVRAYGEGLIIAEQIPSKLAPDVIKNTAVKVVHRLPAGDDRETVGATMNLSDAQSRHVVALVPGEAAVYADGMDRPMLVRVPDGTASEATGDGLVAAVTELVGRRSPTCGHDCHAEPCSLRDIRTAQHLLADRRWVTVWAELTVLAHLTGQDAPTVDPSWLRMLTSDTPVRVLDCAVSHAVDDAVAVRSALLQPDVQPAVLAGHCVAVLRAAIVGDETVVEQCALHGFRYLARHYRWLEPWVRLQIAEGGDHRHPDTDEWARRLGTPIDGDTIVEQLAFVDRRWAGTLADQPASDAVTFGCRRPSTLETLIGGHPGDERWHDRVSDALRPFVRCAWPIDHLAPDSHPNAEGP